MLPEFDKKFGRNEIINQDEGRQDIARNSQTEQHNKTLFRRFMPEYPAAQVCARPTAEQGRQQQAVFGNAAFSPHGTPFVDAVKCKRIEGQYCVTRAQYGEAQRNGRQKCRTRHQFEESLPLHDMGNAV